MKNQRSEDPVIIIGAGFAGLGAGIYAQMNGYDTSIIEMHTKPGGLCTSWSRRGFTFDGCIHWLVGSSPLTALHDIWEEVGIAQGRIFINMDEYMRFEGNDGRTAIFYTNIDRLEKHLTELSPADEALIREFTNGIRMCLSFHQPSGNLPFLRRLMMNLRTYSLFVFRGRKIQRWMKTTADDFASRFTDPLLKEAFREMWFPEFSMLFMLFTMAYLHLKNAGYPVGGSMPMSEALEKRYTGLGGTITYGKKVIRIITEDDRAVGVVLDDGTEHRASRVISAADGYNTIFGMLGGKYADAKVKEPFEKWPIFPPLIFVGLGLNRSFQKEPQTVSGYSIPLKEPVMIGESMRSRLWVHAYNHDNTLAPRGKTSMVIMLNSEHGYWKSLAADREAYNTKKEEIAKTIISLLEERFPGISGQVEAVDVATPLTFERYTGNWQGSFEGWQITPSNSGTIMKPMSQILPGLDSFYMCGQWVEPGGGLPTGIMSGRRLIKRICREDGRKFRSFTA